MARGLYVPCYVGLSRHRKTLKAAALLHCDRHKFVGHLLEFWHWAVTNAQSDGSLPGVTPPEIACAAEWEVSTSENDVDFTNALVSAGFLDRTRIGYKLHDWPDYGGRVVTEQEKDRERKRAKGGGIPPQGSEETEGNSGGLPGEIQGNSDVDETREDETRRDETNNNDAAPSAKAANVEGPELPPEDEEPLHPPAPATDDTGAPLTTNPGLTPDGVVCWVALRTEGLFVGVTKDRLAELQKTYPLVDVSREFTRPRGIREWHQDASRRERRDPGRTCFWKHVHGWLDTEQKREHRALKTRVTKGGYVPGTQCECGKAKAEGASCCPGCAKTYAAYTADALSRERTKPMSPAQPQAPHEDPHADRQAGEKPMASQDPGAAHAQEALATPSGSGSPHAQNQS